MQHHLRDNFQPLVVLKPVHTLKITTYKLGTKGRFDNLMHRKYLVQTGTTPCLFQSYFVTLLFRCLV